MPATTLSSYSRILHLVVLLSVRMGTLRCILATAPLLVQQALSQSSSGSIPGASSYVAPAGYPTTAFSSYYPAPSGQEPQPALYDPVLNITYPANLTNPDHLPDDDPDPVYYPKPIAKLSEARQKKIISNVLDQVGKILTDDNLKTNCSKCTAALSAVKSAAQLAPSLLPDAMVKFCVSSGYDSESSCKEDFEATTFGAIWVQILALADVSGLDGQYICNHLSSDYCPQPAVTPLDINDWFPKPKPDDCASRVPSRADTG